MSACSMGPINRLLRRFLSPASVVATFAGSMFFCCSAFGQSATTTTLSISSGGSAVTSVQAGALVTLTATVVSGTTPITPGQVAFCDASAVACTDIHQLGIAQLTTNGTAVYKFRPGGGTHSYKAVFLGTLAYAKSSSSASSLNVSGPLLSTTQAAETYQTSSASWTLNAVVAGGLSTPSPTAPSGSVSFIDTSNSNKILGSANLSGSNSITNFAYRGDLPAPGNTGVLYLTMATTDLNGDGIPDVAAISAPCPTGAPTCVATYYGNRDGSFTNGTVITLESGQGWGLATADLNSDGIPDLLVADISGNQLIFLGNADGSFTQAPLLENPQGANGPVAIGDFNGDGIPDLALLTANNNMSIWLGKGDGTFTQQAASLTLSGYPALSKAVDIDGDGILDLVEVGSKVDVFLGNGDGTFAPKSSFSSGGSIESAVIADFTGDGKYDLAIMEGSPSDGVYISMFKGNGDGTFTALSRSYSDSAEYSFSLGDFNGDGIPDLVSFIFQDYYGDPDAFNNTNSFKVYLGKGDGTFTTTLLSVPGFSSTSGITADLNGDGLTDVITTRGGIPYNTDQTLASLLAQSGWSASAEITGVTPSVGTHLVAASYSGDSNYAASTSAGVTLTATAATLTSPAPGSALTGGTTTFSWTTGTGASQYQLYLGTTGTYSGDLYKGSPTTATSLDVPLTGLPFNGSTIYATLDSKIDGTWVATHYTYTEPQLGVITLPVPGSKLSGSSATFQWTAGTGVTSYELTVGTKWPGSSDIFSSGGNTYSPITVQNLPTNGVTIYVGLRSVINGISYTNYYTYTASGSLTPPALTAPAPGSHLTSPTATFQWSPGNGPSAYLLTVGTKWPGSSDIYGTGVTTATSATVTNLPTNGVNVYVQLRYQYNGAWTALNYTYTAAGTITPPVMISPAPGSVLSGSNVTFNWTPGTGVTAYSLFAGTYRPGYYNIGSSPTLTTTSFTLPNIPTNSKPVYVTLRYQINGVWQTTNYTYTAAPLADPPVMISPAPGSVLPGSTVTFNWTPGAGVTAYALSVGTYGPGYYNIYSSPQLSTTSGTVPNIPTNGKPVYVTLRYLVSGVWLTTGYTYTAQ